MPTPVDLRIWLLTKALGWPGRRVASEVGVSQPTVVRTLERLSNDPPTDQEIQDFVTGGTSTPPRGFPALGKKNRYRDAPILVLAAAAAIILIAVAITVVLIALAVAILSRLHRLPPVEHDRGVQEAVFLRRSRGPPVIPAGAPAQHRREPHQRLPLL